MSSGSPALPHITPAKTAHERTGWSDTLTLGRRIRHFRTLHGRTLRDLARASGTTTSQLSFIENGKREPRLSLLTALAAELRIELADLLAPEPPPDRRATLEIEVERAQRGTLYASLGAPLVRPGKALPLEVLESLAALHGELARRAEEAIATPEEARRANTELRNVLQDRDNYVPSLEELAESAVREAGYRQGTLTNRHVSRIAESIGLHLVHVNDLPHNTRTVTDLEHGRIYLPSAGAPGSTGLRSLALQAIAHQMLGHRHPVDYADHLRQRMEIRYFAAACLIPRFVAVDFLEHAKRMRDLAIEDFRDAFGVTHEGAAHRFTHLATSHLDLRVHTLRVDEAGALTRGYANDGIQFPQDVTGAIEGQQICRHWAARRSLLRHERTTGYHQYTETPQGTFWCTAEVGFGSEGPFSVVVGVPFAAAKWFRGRDTRLRTRSRCPDEACCRRPDPELATRWRKAAWPSARVHAQVLAPLPSGAFPGVDDGEVYAFLERHAAGRPTP